MRSAGLFGLAMHSPIMGLGNGIPAIVGRFAEQTSKGIMWHDIGLGGWLFDFDDEADVARYVPAVLAMARDPKAARARKFVEQRQRETMLLRRPAEKKRSRAVINAPTNPPFCTVAFAAGHYWLTNQNRLAPRLISTAIFPDE